MTNKKTNNTLTHDDEFTSLVHQKLNSPNIKMLLGENTGGQSVFLRLSNACQHISLYGKTGTGTTTLLYNMLISAMFNATPQTLQFILIDGKSNSFDVFENNPFLMQRPIDATLEQSANEIKATFANVKNVVNERIQLLNGHTIHQYNASHENKLPEIVLVIDELSAIRAQYKININVADSIVYLLKEAGAVGVHVIIANQNADDKHIPFNIVANMPTPPLTMMLGSLEEYDRVVFAPFISNVRETFETGNPVGIVMLNNKAVKVPYLSDDDVFKYNQQIIEKYI